jgi:AraC-like DNA-binding protein
MSLVRQPFPMAGRRRAQSWRHQPAFRRPRHFHEEPELNLVAGGCGVLTVGPREIAVQAGTLLWFPPGLDHYLLSASEDFDLFVVGFRPELLEAFWREHATRLSFVRSPQRVADATRRRCCEAFVLAQASCDDLAVERQLLHVLDMLSQEAGSETKSLGNRAATLLLSRPELRRDELARLLGSNRGDVSRLFCRDQGMSLSDFRNRLRALELLRLLEAGASNLTQAALEAGFGSYSQCHRVFRALLGLSPRDYVRAELRDGLADQYEPLPVGGTPYQA